MPAGRVRALQTSPPRAPNTARRMARSVIVRKDSSVRYGTPRGQRAISSAVISSISAS